MEHIHYQLRQVPFGCILRLQLIFAFLSPHYLLLGPYTLFLFANVCLESLNVRAAGLGLFGLYFLRFFTSLCCLEALLRKRVILLLSWPLVFRRLVIDQYAFILLFLNIAVKVFIHMGCGFCVHCFKRGYEACRSPIFVCST